MANTILAGTHLDKKVALILFFLVSLAIVGALLATTSLFSKKQQADQVAQAEQDKAAAIQTVSGLIGSEKENFFNDPDVKKILENKYRLHVDIQTAGSRSIATQGGQKGNASQYDFVFPSGQPAADKIKKDFKIQNSYRVFFTPMAVASWQPVVKVLEQNAIVRKVDNHYNIIDMAKLLTLMNQQTRWQDLPNNTSFKVGRKVLIKSTDIKSSNSAAMYLSLASYIANNKSTVTNDAEITQILPQVAPLFIGQGYMAGSSATPFEDYLLKGMGDSPLVMIYEAQFLSQVETGGIRPDMVLLYPEPTIYAQHILLSLSSNGSKLGNALTTDPELQKIAIKYGFRSNDPKMLNKFQNSINQHKITYVPTHLDEVIDPPTFEVLEKMITQIEQQMK